MKYIIITICMLTSIHSFSQNDEGRKLGWFVSPEIGAIIHSDHLGKTFGGALGVKLLKGHLKAGFQFYGRPGPINAKEFLVPASDGQIYRGSNTLTLRADHGTAGLYLAPVVQLKKVKLEFPIGLGQMGAGYYLTGEDRDTPDGDRVSVWENKLMDERDAGFSTWYEFGSRLFVPMPNQNISLGFGVHYSLAPGWEAYADPTGDLYNNRIRLAFIVSFESN